MESIPRIGTWIIIMNSQWKILIGKRTNTSLGNNKYSLPWGHLDFWETILECWVREVLEETGLIVEISKISVVDYTEDIFEKDQKHYITFFMKTQNFSWTLSTPEPDKHKQWDWMSWEEIKSLKDDLLTPLYSLTIKYPNIDSII